MAGAPRVEPEPVERFPGREEARISGQRQQAEADYAREQQGRTRLGVASLGIPVFGPAVYGLTGQDSLTRNVRDFTAGVFDAGSQAVAKSMGLDREGGRIDLGLLGEYGQDTGGTNDILGPRARAIMQRQGRDADAEMRNVPSQRPESWTEGLADIYTMGLAGKLRKDDPGRRHEALAAQAGMDPELMGERSAALQAGAVPLAGRRDLTDEQKVSALAKRAKQLLAQESARREMSPATELVQGSEVRPENVYEAETRLGISPVEAGAAYLLSDPMNVALDAPAVAKGITGGAKLARAGVRYLQSAPERKLARLTSSVPIEEGRLMSEMAQYQRMRVASPQTQSVLERAYDAKRAPQSPLRGLTGAEQETAAKIYTGKEEAALARVREIPRIEDIESAVQAVRRIPDVRELPTPELENALQAVRALPDVRNIPDLPPPRTPSQVLREIADVSDGNPGAYFPNAEGTQFMPTGSAYDELRFLHRPDSELVRPNLDANDIEIRLNRPNMALSEPPLPGTKSLPAAKSPAKKRAPKTPSQVLREIVETRAEAPRTPETPAPVMADASRTPDAPLAAIDDWQPKVSPALERQAKQAAELRLGMYEQARQAHLEDVRRGGGDVRAWDEYYRATEPEEIRSAREFLGRPEPEPYRAPEPPPAPAPEAAPTLPRMPEPPVAQAPLAAPRAPRMPPPEAGSVWHGPAPDKIGKRRLTAAEKSNWSFWSPEQRQKMVQSSTGPRGGGGPRVGMSFEPDAPPVRNEQAQLSPMPEPEGPQPGMSLQPQTATPARPQAKPIPMPALVRFVEEVTGSRPGVDYGLKELGKKLGGTVQGRVRGRTIALNPAEIEDPAKAAQILGHEIGHLPDLVPTVKEEHIAGSLSGLRKRMRTWFRQMDEGTRKELWELSREWRPFDETDAKMMRYRQDPEELFADALSRVFNDPDALKQRAPKFWQGFTKMLDANPRLKQSVADVHAWRSGTTEDLVKGLRQQLDTENITAEELFKGLALEAKAREDSLLFRMASNHRALYDSGGAMKAHANALERRGIEVPEHIDPRITYDEWQMGDGATKHVMETFNQEAIAPLRAAGIDETTAGRYIEMQAIADGHRAKMANPGGTTSAEAEEALKQILDGLTPEQQAVLKKSVEHTQKMFWEALELGEDLIGKEALDRLRQHKGSLAPMLELGRLNESAKWEDVVSALETGSFEAAANPLITMVQQTLAVRNFARRNKAKAAIADYIRAFEPDEISDVAGGGRQPFSVYRNGQKETVYADPYLERLFQTAPSPDLASLNKAIAVLSGKEGPPLLKKILGGVNQAAMQLWLRLSPSFYLAQLGMDVSRSSRNLAALGIYNAATPGNSLRVLKSWLKAAKPALDYARKKPNDLISKMIQEHAIEPAANVFGVQLTGDQISELRQIDLLLAKSGIGPEKVAPTNPVRRALSRLSEWIDTAGRFSQALPKVGAYQEIGGKMSAAKRAHVIRTKIGQPAGYVRGTLTQSSGNMLAFANTILQGLRSDVHLLATPKTRTGWLIANLKHTLGPSMLMALAGGGALGQDVKEMHDAVPERDRKRGLVIPFGWEEGGEFGKRLRYALIPYDPSDALVSALLHDALHAPYSDKEAQDYTAGLWQTFSDFSPGLSPALESAGAMRSALMDEEPEDSSGKPIVTRDEAQAGLLPRMGGLVRWQLGQGGIFGQVVQRKLFQENLTNETDWWASKIPFMQRFLKVSDSGFSAKQRRDIKLEEREKARLRVAYGPNARELRQNYNRLEKLGRDKRTEQQEDAYYLLKGWHGRLESTEEAIANADSERERQQLRREFEQESAEYMQDLQKTWKKKW